jgi:hypothetical protein
MKCIEGHDNPEDARFCQECGVRIQSTEEPAQEPLGQFRGSTDDTYIPQPTGPLDPVWSSSSRRPASISKLSLVSVPS